MARELSEKEIAQRRQNNDVKRASTGSLYGRKELQKDLAGLTERTVRWLQEGDRLERLFEETKLKDITVMLGILTDKTLVLEGQPTQIIGTPQQAQLDQIGQALQEALQQRGLAKTVTLTQQTAKIELQGEES